MGEREVIQRCLYVTLGFFLTICFFVIHIKSTPWNSSPIDMSDYARKKQFDYARVEERNRFLDTIVDETVDRDDVFQSLERDANESGIFSFFVPQNFVDVICKAPAIRFANKTMPPVALVSFPGSGNTWYRELIERTSGIATAAYGCGLPGLEDAFIGNCGRNISRTIVRKIHQVWNISGFEAAILIIRNPFEAILAEFNRRNAGKTGVVAPERFRLAEWTRFVKRGALGWLLHVRFWLLKFNRPLLVSFYENMSTKFYRELFRVAKFLGVKITFKGLWCAKQTDEGNFHRKKPDWLTVSSVFPEESKKILEMVINSFRGIFQSRYGSVEIPF